MRPERTVLAALCIALATPAFAEPASVDIGGDRYRAGSGSGDRLAAPRDVFVSGGSVAVRGAAEGVAHAMGFDVEIEIDAANAYAMGAVVEIDARIAGDATAMGASVKLDEDARIGGNARLMGGWVTAAGQVEGALVAMGAEVILEGVVEGDARLVGGDIRFGDDARVGGVLTYSAPERIDVPVEVAPADRVVFEPMSASDLRRDVDEAFSGAAGFAVPAALSIVAGFLVLLAFLVLVAALALSFAPETVEARRKQTLERPGATLLLGAAALSLLFGLGPVSAMTLIGLPFLPVILLALLIAWIAGYVLGAYVVGVRLWTGLGGDEPKIAGRLAVIAAMTTLVALMNFIPVVGWLFNFALTLFGVGALAAWALTAAFGAGLGRPAPAAASDEP